MKFRYPSYRLAGCLLTVLLGFPLWGQNIIPDPGFEEWNGMSGSQANTLTGMTHWYNANGTADLHHIDRNPGNNLTGLNPCPLGQGRTDCGEPIAGKGVLGFFKGNGADGSKEWAGTELLEPMVAGDCYEISYWIQNKRDDPAREIVTNNWGVFFSETRQPGFNPNLFNFDLVADNFVVSDVIVDGQEWMFITLNYVADKDYEYAFIGFMGNVSDATQRIYNDDDFLGAYVFMDEFYVRHVDVDVPDPIEVCVGEAVTIEFVSDYPIEWTDGMVTDTTRAFDIRPLESATYYVTATGATGCTKVDSVTVTVNAPTSAAFPDEFCLASVPFALNPEAPPGIWLGPGIVDAEAGIFEASVAGIGMHQVYFAADAGCAQSVSYDLEVLDIAEPGLTVDTLGGCTPLPITIGLTEETELGGEYRWSIGDTTFTTAEAPLNYVIDQGGSITIAAELVYGPRCVISTALPAAINVNQSPNATFTATPEVITNLEGEVTFRDVTEDDIVAWRWSVDTLATGNAPTFFYDFTQPGSFNVSLQVTDVDGCVDSTGREILVRPEVRIYMPTAFSPNDDGVNDRFGPGLAGPLAEYRLDIFNRWGGLVFTSSDPEEGWDGLAKSGKTAETGPYLYQLIYRTLGEEGGALSPATEVISGSFQLIR